MAENNADNPQIVVNGFLNTGITAALEGIPEEDEETVAMDYSDSEDDDFEVAEDYYKT